MIQGKLQKVHDHEVHYLVEASKKDAQKDILDSAKVFGTLIASIERRQSELIKLMKKKQRAIKRTAKSFIKALEQEISALQRMCTELEQLSYTLTTISTSS